MSSCFAVHNSQLIVSYILKFNLIGELEDELLLLEACIRLQSYKDGYKGNATLAEWVCILPEVNLGTEESWESAYFKCLMKNSKRRRI